MIDYDYELIVDMGTKRPVYHPNQELPKKLKNIFKLEGPNSCGKSTLMNIIALSSYGLRSNRINESIKSRMYDLVSSDYKKLSFNVVLDDPVSKTKLHAVKDVDSRDIFVEESVDGGDYVAIGSDQFEKKYNLIYDIPDNPIGRISQITNELYEWQKSYETDCSELQKYVGSINSQIRDSRNESTIKQLENDIKSCENNIKSYTNSGDTKYVRSLETFLIAKKILKYESKVKEAKQSYESIRQVEEKKPVSDEQYNTNIVEKRNKIIGDLSSLATRERQFIINITKINDTELNEIRKKLEKINIEEAIDDVEKIEVTKEALKNAYRRICLINGEETDNQEKEIVEKMLRVLEKYRNKDISIPGLGSVNKLISTLENLDAPYNSASGRTDAIKNCISNFDPLYNSMADIAKEIKKVGKIKEGDNVELRDENKIAIAESNVVRLSKKLSEALRDGSKYNIEHTNVRQVLDKSFDEISGRGHIEKDISVENLESIYDEMVGQTEEENRRYRSETEKLGRFKAKFEEENNKKESSYKNHTNALKYLTDELYNLSAGLKNSSLKIENIEKKTYGNYSKEDYLPVWKYIGRRLGFVHHIQDTYEVESVDVIEDTIYTKDGTIIRMKDMGTGQSQLSYLTGLLSSDDGRKIIALFDEVSTMTESTLGIIFDKFIELQNNGNLMIGMMVMPSDEIKVVQYGV